MNNKITNKMVYEALNMPRTTYDGLKARSPRQVELIKKGLVAEMILKDTAFSLNIKGYEAEEASDESTK